MAHILLASAKMKNFVRISVAVREELGGPGRAGSYTRSLGSNSTRSEVEIQPGSLLGSRLNRTRRQYPVRM